MVYDTQNVMITFAYNDHHIIVEYALYLQNKAGMKSMISNMISGTRVLLLETDDTLISLL